MKPRKILIIKLGSLGDVVHTLPTLHILRKSFPQAQIDWVIESKSRDIIEDNPDLNKVIVFNRTSSIRKTSRAFLRLVKDLRNKEYDTVLEMQGNFKGGLLAWLTKSPVRLGFRAGSSRVEWISTLFTNFKVDEGDEAHIIERNLNFAKKLGAEVNEVVFPITIDKDAREYIDVFFKEQGISNRKTIVLHPGVTWETKRWPEEKYARLADEIREKFPEVRVILTYGPSEKGLAETVKKLCRSKPVLSCPTNLGQMIALLSRCQLLVSSDTGPLHLTAALGKKVIGLYGPIDSRRNGPYGEGNVVIKKELDCQPCWRKQCSHLKCMQEIEVTEVMGKIIKLYVNGV